MQQRCKNVNSLFNFFITAYSIYLDGYNGKELPCKNLLNYLANG